jgi:hypothetical protein
VTDDGRGVNVASLSQDLYEFAVELRQLAYTMPGGQENRLIDLSERMLRCARTTPTPVAPAMATAVTHKC